jgi:hemoglobin-like flavoprotein
MTTRQIEIVRATWQLAATNAETVGPLFYETLFEIAPDVKNMFTRTAMPEQSKKLVSMLWYIISNLNSRTDIVDEITKLAQRHVKYGVEEKHYSYVGAALVMTLEKAIGDFWNEEVKDAWVACYGMLSSAMMNATGLAKQKAA